MTQAEIEEFEQWAADNADDPNLKTLLECAELFFASLILAKNLIRSDNPPPEEASK